MEFSLEALHRMDADLAAVLQSIGNLDQTALKGKNKDNLIGFVLKLAGAVNHSQLLLKSAAAKIDDMKSDALNNQKSLISLQKEVIQKKSEQLKSVETTVKEEIKTWAGVVTKSCSNMSTAIPKKMKEVVSAAVTAEDRSHNVVIFGATEEEDQDKEHPPVTDDVCVQKIFDKVGLRRCVVKHHRAGLKKTGQSRPLIVRMKEPHMVMEALVNAKVLKETLCYKTCYLAPDRSPEQRAAHRQLITEMKKRREEQPDMYFFIKGGEVCCVERTAKQAKDVTLLGSG
jgi:hypothetical protein